MKIFGQIVFYDKVGKEATEEGGKKIPPSNRADPSLPLGRRLHLTALLNFSPNLRFHREMTTLLDKDHLFELAFRTSQNKEKEIFLS